MHRKKVIAAIALSGILIAGGTGGCEVPTTKVTGTSLPES